MSELYHHGIKGQKWGAKNGPPYPLNSKQLNSYNRTHAEGCNPSNYKNNCKDVAFIIADNIANDSYHKAGPKSLSGNIYDYATKRAGFSLGRMERDYREVKVNSSDAALDVLKTNILKRYGEGAVGVVGFKYDDKYLRNGSTETNHAINWVVQDGEVIFFDGQNNTADTDLAKRRVRCMDINEKMELLCYDRHNEIDEYIQHGLDFISKYSNSRILHILK